MRSAHADSSRVGPALSELGVEGQHEQPPAAGRVAGPGRVERASDGHRHDRRQGATIPARRPQRSLRQRLAALHEGDAHAARPCRDREAEGALVVRRIICRRNPWPSRDVRDGLALAVDADLQLMDVGPGVGRFDLELVFSVEREIAVDLQPAARAERQCLVAAVLRLPHRRDVGVHQRTHVGIAHGHAADLERRCQIALHRCRRDKQRVSQIVEAAARVVGRQQRGVVELLGQIRQREQIADHVGVFGPRQAVSQRQ